MVEILLVMVFLTEKTQQVVLILEEMVEVEDL